MIAIASVIIAPTLVAFLSLTGPGGSAPTTCDAPPGYILIIADRQGFNSSITHGAPKNPWPLIQVRKGETVNIFVCNLDRVEPHGFAIDHYFDRGVALKPGDTYKLTFVANEAGKFAIFCNVFCSVHPFMLGQLAVSS